MPFQNEGRVTLDGNGNGLVRLEQVPVFRKRAYIRVTVSISTGEASATTGGEARMYRGNVYPTNFITGTSTPWSDTSTLEPNAALLEHPLELQIDFTNCDPNAEAFVTATYEEQRIQQEGRGN